MDLVRLNAKVYRSKTGVYTEIPVLLTEYGVIDSFVEFFLIIATYVAEAGWKNT